MNVTDEAITKIKDMIISVEHSAGDRLPPEKELSVKLDLTRSSSREAVKALEIIRVLDVRRGDGTYVTSLEPQLLTCAMAAGRITAEQIAGLQTTMENIDNEKSVEQLVEHDLIFHGLITAVAENSYLASVLHALSGGTVRARTWRGLSREKPWIAHSPSIRPSWRPSSVGIPSWPSRS